jgi:dolichol-phosphate mannosyltransferase
MAKRGAKITEIPVNFKARKHGKSKYGISRILDVLVDIIAFYFFEKFHNKPFRFFGIAGFLSFLLSAATFIFMLILRFYWNISFIQTPLPVLAVSFGIVGFQFILMGLIAELVYRFNKDKNINPNHYIKEEIIT